VNAFLSRLRERGVVAHLRRTRGDDVNAACGQLRARHVALSTLVSPVVLDGRDAASCDIASG
jgi:hypothetical protein